MTNSKARFLAFGLLLILTTGACGVTQTSDQSRTVASTSSRDNDPQSLLRKSQRSAPDEAARMRLNAAESFRASGDVQQARATLQSIDPTPLDALNQFTYYNMSALLAIDAHDYAAAR
jgi:outer membrane PBP1 activator LpoA protein